VRQSAIWRLITVPHHYTQEAAAAWIARQHERTTRPSAVPLWLTPGGTAIGDFVISGNRCALGVVYVYGGRHETRRRGSRSNQGERLMAREGSAVVVCNETRCDGRSYYRVGDEGRGQVDKPPFLFRRTTVGVLSGVAAGLGLSLTPAGALAASSTSIPKLSVPAATQASAYTQQLAVPGGAADEYSFTAVDPLPPGLAISAGGVLSGTPTAKPGPYTIEVELVPLSNADVSQTTPMYIDVELTIQPSLAIQQETNDIPAPVPWSPATADLPAKATGSQTSAVVPLDVAGGNPTLGGRIACSGSPGCNTSGSTFGTDSGGNAMTQWTQVYDGSAEATSCSVKGYTADYIENTANGAQMGAYVDDSADSGPGVYTNRQTLVNCLAAQGVQVILVGLYPSETGTSFETSNGVIAGSMLEWYPYCWVNGTNEPAGYTGYPQYDPPSWGQIAALGYIVQQNYYDESDGCTAGPTTAQHNTEWNYAWGQIDDAAFGPYNDLLASF